MGEVAGHVSPHTPALLLVRVVDGVVAVEVVAVLSEDLGEDNVPLVAVHVVVGVAVDKEASQGGVGVDIENQVCSVYKYF